MKEFQIIIDLTQYGHSLFPFTEKTQRILLPLLNKPILIHLIENFQKQHVDNFIFICRQDHIEEIRETVLQQFQLHQTWMSFFFECKNEHEGMVYKISSLYLNKILRHDFMFINTNTFAFLQLSDILEQHYQNDRALTCVLFNQKESDQMYLINESNQALVKIIEDQQKTKVRLSIASLSTNKLLDLKTGLSQAGIYVFSFDVCRILLWNCKKLKNLDDEMITFMINNQFKRALSQMYTSPLTKVEVQEILNEQEKNDEKTRKRSMSQFEGPFMNYQEKQSCLNVGYYIQNNSIWAFEKLSDYWQLNQHALKAVTQLSSLSLNTNNNSELSGLKDKVSIVSKDAKIEENSTINQSIIGHSSWIESSKITGSLLMNNVIIEQDCQVTNCIIGTNVLIQKGITLINSIIGDDMQLLNTHQKVIKDETISALDTQVEIR